MLCNLLRLF